MWNLPGPGIELVFPALAGGFFTTAPPGKSWRAFCLSWWEEMNRWNSIFKAVKLAYYISHRAQIQRRQWHPTPVLLPGKSHGWRSLVGCSPWGCEESYTTARLHFHFSLSYIGEGNGNPLQCSCLENPRDGGAWWAAVYRTESAVAQSRTRLKRLSSSSRAQIVISLHCIQF